MLTSSSIESKTSSMWLQHLSLGRLALLAGVLVVLSGIVNLADLEMIANIVTLPLLSLLGLSVIALSVYEVGVFTWAARMVARLSQGDGRRLFTNLYILSTIVTVLFPNDATILLFTPLVLHILYEIRDRTWHKDSFLPFLLTIVFGANAASISLVTSNPINMIYATYFDLAYLDYARLMLLPGFVSTLVCFVLLRWASSSLLPSTYRLVPPKVDTTVIAPTTTSLPFKVAIAVVIGMFFSYFILSALGLAYHYAIFCGSVIILWPVYKTKEASLWRVIRRLPWDELLFVTGMFTLAFGLTNLGLTEFLRNILLSLSQQPLLWVTLGNSALIAVGANMINDWPMSLFSSLVVDSLPNLTASVEKVLVYTSIISANLGNKIMPHGSLATLIWLGVIRRISGIHITWSQFIRIGLLVTPLTLLAASLTLWLEILWGGGA